MKFRKLFLDEEMFDSSENGVDTSYSDDSFSGPESGPDVGVADILISSINDEWETIRNYNSLIATLRAESSNNPIYETFINVVEDIVVEENKHVGQLQEVLKQISPNVQSIQQGEDEGRDQLNFANGRLQVQSWDTYKTTTTPVATNDVSDMCAIDDVDDEM